MLSSSVLIEEGELLLKNTSLKCFTPENQLSCKVASVVLYHIQNSLSDQLTNKTIVSISLSDDIYEKILKLIKTQFNHQFLCFSYFFTYKWTFILYLDSFSRL